MMLHDWSRSTTSRRYAGPADRVLLQILLLTHLQYSGESDTCPGEYHSMHGPSGEAFANTPRMTSVRHASPRKRKRRSASPQKCSEARADHNPILHGRTIKRP
ncbi:hypothetical protein MRB53_040723 [Persea americana]|nr:hypothetical protein MRB53_040723 [Persea americana]